MLTTFCFAQISTDNRAKSLFLAGQRDQQNQQWSKGLAKFKQIIKAYPNTSYAQKAYIEIGKFYKYNRHWDVAIAQYHKAIAIAPHSRPAHDAKTAEGAVYYFRQDFPRALKIFKEVLAETRDWDQIKYCSYWIKEVKRKMSFPSEKSFACGPEALRIALGIFGIKADRKEVAALFDTKEKEVSLLALNNAASSKGLKPKVAKLNRDQLQNVNTPFIALVNPEHYVVVTEAGNGKVSYIDPSSESSQQTFTLDEFGRNFKGYALIFVNDAKIAKADYLPLDDQRLKELKGGVCYCCPPGDLGGPEGNPNTEYDGDAPCGTGMPSWMVNTATLNLVVQDIDFSYSSRGMPVELVRTFNGDDPNDSIFGRSWTFNYNLILKENPDQSIDIRRGDGKVDHFFWNGTRYQGPEGVFDSLVKNQDGTYSLKLKVDKFTYNFNATGRLANIKDRNNNTIVFTYNAQSLLTRITDPNNKNLEFVYGANNKVSKVTLPDGRFASFAYDASGNVAKVIDMAGATSSFTYDSASYITSITTPHHGTTSISYDSGGEGYYVTAITDTLGNKRFYDTYRTDYEVKITDSRNNIRLYVNDYDGNTQSITTASGSSVIFEYDSFGNRSKIKDGEGNITFLVYNTRGNPTLITDPLNNKTTLEYDSNDNLIKSTDAKGNVYNFTYDAKSNLLSVKDADSQTTSFAYNSYGQPTRLTDAKNGVTDFAYDVSGNLLTTTDPLGKTINYTYDGLGRPISLINQIGGKFSYAYDGLDRLTKVTYPDNSVTTYTRNCCNLIQLQDKNGTLKFSYDALGRMKDFTNYDNKVVSYDYNSEGNIINLTYPDNKKVSYEYDLDNRLSKVTDWLSNVTKYSYDLRGNLSSSASKGVISIYKYDKAGQLVKLFNYNPANMAVVSGFEFTPDAVGNRAKIKKYLPLATANFSNLPAAYSYNSDNQLTSATNQTFTYDNNGNLTNRSLSGTGPTAFTYNYDNQLTQVLLRGTTGNETISYAYDALGNRIKKTSGSNVTKYLVDPNRALPSVLCEANASGVISAYYVYGLGLISKIEGSSAYFYQYDGIGSTVAITDATGAIKNKYVYDDFGNVATNSVEAVSNPFKYVGKYGVATDAPDLLYMRARYYMPSVGRFINKDPIGLSGGMNMYGYVGGNPVRYIDPKGLLTWPYTWQGWGGVILMGAGSVTMTIPGLQGVGVGMIWGGVVLSGWDLIEGLRQAEEVGRRTGEIILDRDREEWDEIDRELGRCSIK